VNSPENVPANATITLGVEVELVVPITNPTNAKLEEVIVYLEHLGGSDADFTPLTWNVAALGPGEVFFALWPLRTIGYSTGEFNASVVVHSRRTDPVRLAARFRVTRLERE